MFEKQKSFPLLPQVTAVGENIISANNDFTGNNTFAGATVITGTLKDGNNNDYATTEDLVFEKGTGHDSFLLKTTPNPEDPSVDRTNYVSGQFSGAAGSRNTVGGNESFSIGGRNTVNGSDCFAGGYRGLIDQGAENSCVYGYKNEIHSFVSNTMVGGKESKVYANENGNTKTYHSIVWGRKNVLGSTGQSQEIESSAVFGNENSVYNNYCLVAGTSNTSSYGACSLFGTHLQSSAYGQTIVGRYCGVPNTRAIFVVGCGFNDAPKTCFSAGWYEQGTSEDERKVIWVGDTKISEKQFKQLLALLS